MKTIIAGSRHITNPDILIKALLRVPWVITEVVCGMAKGVDTLGANWAIENNIPIDYYPADWNKYGKKAGPIRNREMLDNAEALLVIWDGESRGSRNMFQTWIVIKGEVNIVVSVNGE